MEYEDKLILRLLIAILIFLVYDYIYFIFLFFTKYFSFLTINLLGYSSNLIGNELIINGKPLQIIPACVAMPAYYLLFLLTITTKGLKFKTMIKILAAGILLILVMNILRIDILIILLL